MTTTIAIALAIFLSLPSSSSSSPAAIVIAEDRTLPSRRSLQEDDGAVMCPNDVLECPDGMSLERNPENGCEFGDCPADDGNNNAGGGRRRTT